MFKLSCFSFKYDMVFHLSYMFFVCFQMYEFSLKIYMNYVCGLAFSFINIVLVVINCHLQKFAILNAILKRSD